MSIRVAVFGVFMLLLVGCGGPRLTWQQKMDSSSGVERAQAVMVVGERNMRSEIPQVIERLEDHDPSVRMVAVRTLREMTGRNFGYVVYADESERLAAARRWRKWWESEGQRGAEAVTTTGEKP